MFFKFFCGDKIFVVLFFGCWGIIIVNGWILWMIFLLISFIILIIIFIICYIYCFDIFMLEFIIYICDKNIKLKDIGY